MKKFNLALLLSLFAINALFITGCKEDEVIDEPQSIVEIATSDEQFSTLVEALQKANLVSALEEDGPFTVFAPTNTAFDNLFTDLGVSGLDDLSAEALRPILLFHVLGVEAKSGSLATGYVPTLSTGANSRSVSLQVDLSSGVVVGGSSKVTTADVDATNGVIHIIDKVMLPPNVVDLALQNGAFSSLVAALTRSDLTFDFVGYLSEAGPYTVFAPTDAAFTALLDSNPAWNSLADIDAATLDAVLKYHVVAGTNFDSGSLSNGLSLTTAGGESFTANVEGSAVSLVDPNGTSNVIIADVQGTNGVVHAIDRVLLP